MHKSYNTETKRTILLAPNLSEKFATAKQDNTKKKKKIKVTVDGEIAEIERRMRRRDNEAFDRAEKFRRDPHGRNRRTKV